MSLGDLKTENINRPQIKSVPANNAVLDTGVVSILRTATPDVQNVPYFYSHSSAVTVTNFKHGQDGQTIKILGNGNTTITNNANIKTNTGANKVLAANMVYTFTYFNKVWYEDS